MRSRNDQIALDLRLDVKAEIAQISAGLRSLQTALLDFAQQHVDVVMPGYTHLQRAQPIFLAHYLRKLKLSRATQNVSVIATHERMFCRAVPAQ